MAMTSPGCDLLRLELHYHSEGAARLSLQWWLSTTLLQRLASSSEVTCKVVTGHGKSRQVWDRSDIQAAALETLRSLELKPWIVPQSLALDSVREILLWM